MLIEGKLPSKYGNYADLVKNYYLKKDGEDRSVSKHYWINKEQGDIKQILDTLRNAPEIKETLQKAYPDYKIQPVHSSDEVYISVDPSLRKNSDIALSDCHYDAPFKYVYQCGNIFTRVILGLTENKTIYTTIGDKKSLLSTLDFNAMDYNSDYHCVEGNIPKGDIRILLKLHFLCIHPQSSNTCISFTQNLNDWWTHFSREVMRQSAKPTNFWEQILAKIIVTVRYIYNKSSISILTLSVIICFLYFKKSKRSKIFLLTNRK